MKLIDGSNQSKDKRVNNTYQDYPLDKCLHEFIEEQTQKTPYATALTFNGQRLSYETMNRQANQLAHFLQDKGIGPETLVGICAFRSIEMVTGLLAIIKAGGAYVPFDPTYPAKRLAFMIEDSNVPIMLAQKACAPLLSESETQVVYFEDITEQLEKYPFDNLKTNVKPENLAYVIYTSGSTGNPKGVMNTHRAIVNRLLWMQDTFQISTSDTLIQKTPYSFDVSVWEFFWPFMCGARLVVARPEGHKDAQYLLELIARQKVTVIHFVPSMLRLFLEAADQKQCETLKHVILSGEALTIDLLRRYYSTLKTPLHNLYGPTEAAVDVSYWKCDPDYGCSAVPIGRPISNTTLYIIDSKGKTVPIGESGELHIGGVQVARGYLNRPELTAEKFIRDPFSKDLSARLYKTGDLCRFLPDGNLEYLGRIDFQVKIHGNRIELGEIEAAILDDPMIRQCAVIVREDSPGEKRLVAYIVEKGHSFSLPDMRNKLAEELPDYMIPAIFVTMPELPLTPSGKTDRRALPKPGRQRPKLANPYIIPGTETEKKVAGVWSELLQLDKVGIDDNFFELGGDSLMALKMVTRLHSMHGFSMPVVKLFQFPTISKLADFLDNDKDNISFIDEIHERATRQRIGRFHDDPLQDGIAIIGMAGRFPGAATIDQLWTNLCNEVESISTFSREELEPWVEKDLINDPDYVPARGIIENADTFDAEFFGIGPQEAKAMDPQQRVFLELAWAAMENAGYDSEQYNGVIGVYAGVGDNHYYPHNVLAHPEIVDMVGKIIVGYGNEKDYIATRISYALNLTGPSVSANTGCSTTLLAVDNAFRALLNYECDMALAGGVDIFVPQKSGFLYEAEGVFSKDGHCRPFDSKATGTMFCDGAGIVVLKRLADARADGDRIYAIIRGSAKNNDGADKVSFLAPSVAGQAKVIAMAQAQANVTPDQITYIEAHGTGTPLGDPIEIEALTKIFRAQTDKKQYCLIGSIKGNIGHPTIASGVAGLIKAALCLYHEKIPATLHYKAPNAKIDFENSPFKVVDQLTPWPRSGQRRIAGVSSFGFGGTNVHTILEESPAPRPSGVSRPQQLLLVSAKTSGALERTVQHLKTYLKQNPDINPADTAYTLQQGRRHLAHRRFLVCKDTADAVEMLENPEPLRSKTRFCQERNPEIAFMFPGQGAQYVKMGKNLYDHEPLFKETVDDCCNILFSYLGCDLREFLYPSEHDLEKAEQSLKNTFFTQPALFMIEYALARLLQHWGIQPSAMIGHSVGEFVSACLADVFSLEDALRLVARRGQLISKLPAGSMLAVRCNASGIETSLPADIQLAAVNSPSLCVVSGPTKAIARFQRALEHREVPCQQLHTSHAFHSAMMDPIVESFIREVSSIKLSRPAIPFVSTVTTRWISDKEATDPVYWGRHLRMPVLFSSGIEHLQKIKGIILVEVGPRETCATLARQHFSPHKKVPVTATLSDTHAQNAEYTSLLSALGYLWMHGATPNWPAFYSSEKRHRIPLPTYPFEPKRHWLDPLPKMPASEVVNLCTKCDDIEKSECQSDEQKPENKKIDEFTGYFVSCIEAISGLNLQGVEPSTTFLEMGMDSLLLSQLAYKIKSDFKVKVIFSQLMRELSTIDLVAGYIRSHRAQKVKTAASTCDLPIIPESKRTQERIKVPVTLAQKAIWSSSSLSHELSCAYNESITVQLNGDIKIPLIEKALYGLVHRHDALRATFCDDGAFMTITAQEAIDLRRIDLSTRDKKKAEEQYGSILQKDAATPIDLDSGPLLRCLIFIMPGKHCYVVLTTHHIVCDGWSLDVLISDFCNFYNRLCHGKELSPERAYSFAEYAHIITARCKTKEYAAARTYWLNRFENSFPVLHLPADNPENRMASYNAQRMDRHISGDAVERLKKLCKQNKWSQFTVLTAAFKLLLYRISGQQSFTIGLPTAMQPLIGHENLVGLCSNLVPLCCPIEKATSYENFIDAVQEALLQAYDHQIYNFIDMLCEEGFACDNAGAPLLPAGLTSVKKYAPEQLSFSNAAADYFANPRAYESFEIYLNVVETGDSLELKCHFQTDLFHPSTIQTWLHLYEQILEQIAHNPKALHAKAPIIKRHKQYTRQITLMPPCSYNEISGELLPIWQKVFKNTKIGIHDNFFNLGGHSLLAARLFAEIKKTMNIAAPLSALYDAPTIFRLAHLLEKIKSGCNYRSLVAINAKGTRPPIYLVHPADGNTLMYRHLAAYLGEDQPVYGIQSKGYDGKTEFDPTFEHVARNYIKEIKAHQPSGPYILGGYCLGGTIALEMAQQLMRQGEEIGLLFMIENYNVKTIKWPMPLHLRTINRILNIFNHISNLLAHNNEAKFAFFKQKAMIEYSRLKTFLQVLFSSLLIALGIENTLDFPHIRIDSAYEKAMARYTPNKFSGKIILFGAKKRLLGLTDPKYGWSRIAEKGIQLYELPIRPRASLVEPYVRMLAAKLRVRLDELFRSSAYQPALCRHRRSKFRN